MTPTQHKRAERWAKASLERLIVGWEGALFSTANNKIAANVVVGSVGRLDGAQPRAGLRHRAEPDVLQGRLSRMQIDANEVTQNFRRHDEPEF